MIKDLEAATPPNDPLSYPPLPEGSSPPHDTTSTVKPTRMDWIDKSRGAAILLVVFFHAGSYLHETGQYHSASLVAIYNFFAPFRMPLLFMLSGLFLPRSMSKGFYRHIYGKVRGVLWPYLIWTFIFAIMIRPDRIFSLSLWQGGTYLWYMAFILSFYAIAVAVGRLHYLVVSTYAISIALIMPDNTMYKGQLFTLMAFFFFGAFIGRNISRFTEFLSSRISYQLIPLAIVFAVLSSLYGPIRYEPMYAIDIVVSVLAFLTVLYLVSKSKLSAPLQYIGQNSIIVYVVHVPVMRLLQDKTDLLSRFDGPTVIAISFFVPLLVAIGFIPLSQKYRLVGYLFKAPDFARETPRLLRKPVGMVDRYLSGDVHLPAVRPAADRRVA